MDSPEKDVVETHEGTKDESAMETGDLANAANQTGDETSAPAVELGTRNDGDEQEEEETYDDESEGELSFEPFDINNDGRIVKTASQCSRGSWKRPEAGWDVTITVHRFCDLSPSKEAAPGEETQNQQHSVEPEFLQLAFKLGEDEDEGFPQETNDQAGAAGVKLHPLLHCGIVTMGRNERASFVVTADDDGAERGAEKNSANGKTTTELAPRRFEYDISLDDWVEEIDLSGQQDNSLVKRIIRDGDETTRPVDIGGVAVRCRVIRMPIAQEPLKGSGDDEELGDETVLFDNLQSQDEDPASEDGEGLKGPLSFVLDDCPFGPGVMTVLKSMSTGEQCEAWLDPKHGPVDDQDDGSFYHQVVLELVEVEELPPVFAAEEVRLEMSGRFKAEGNEKFTAGDYDRALRRYEKAIKYADGVPPGEDSEDGDGNDTSSSGTMEANDKESEPDTTTTNNNNNGNVCKEAFVDLQVAVLCNQAACFLKLGDGSSALEVADRASRLKAVAADSPAGMKAAYRRACALEAVGDWDEARDAFKSVLSVAPKNSQCRQGVARLARAKRAYEANLRKTFGGCLASNKLKGFASEGREVPESARFRDDGDGNFGGGRGLSADGHEEGPWSEGSDSEEESGYSSSSSNDNSSSGSSSSGDDDEEDTKAAEDRRVEALYKIATGGGDGGGDDGDCEGDGEGDGDGKTAPVVREKNAAAVDTTTATEPAEAEAPAKTVTQEAGTAAPSSEPEVIPLSALPALAKEYAAADTPSEEEPPQKPPLAPNDRGQAAETGALREDGDIPLPVPPSS
eukprot:g10645.t1